MIFNVFTHRFIETQGQTFGFLKKNTAKSEDDTIVIDEEPTDIRDEEPDTTTTTNTDEPTTAPSTVEPSPSPSSKASPNPAPQQGNTEPDPSTPQPSVDGTTESKSSEGIPAGTLAAIVISAAAILGLMAGVVIFYLKKSHESEDEDYDLPLYKSAGGSAPGSTTMATSYIPASSNASTNYSSSNSSSRSTQQAPPLSQRRTTQPLKFQTQSSYEL